MYTYLVRRLGFAVITLLAFSFGNQQLICNYGQDPFDFFAKKLNQQVIERIGYHRRPSCLAQYGYWVESMLIAEPLHFTERWFGAANTDRAL